MQIFPVKYLLCLCFCMEGIKMLIGETVYLSLTRLQVLIYGKKKIVEVLKDSHLKGTMTVEQGQELLFTIPWDEGWTCYVDGEKTQLTKVLGLFMAVQATPGEHTYEMKYFPVLMDIGLWLCGAALLGFVGAGSQAEYGRVNHALTPDTPCFPENGYGMAKLCAGQMSRVECEKLGLVHIWPRILSVYGPYDGKNAMITTPCSRPAGTAPSPCAPTFRTRWS